MLSQQSSDLGPPKENWFTKSWQHFPLFHETLVRACDPFNDKKVTMLQLPQWPIRQQGPTLSNRTSLFTTHIGTLWISLLVKYVLMILNIPNSSQTFCLFLQPNILIIDSSHPVVQRPPLSWLHYHRVPCRTGARQHLLYWLHFVHCISLHNVVLDYIIYYVHYHLFSVTPEFYSSHTIVWTLWPHTIFGAVHTILKCIEFFFPWCDNVFLFILKLYNTIQMHLLLAVLAITFTIRIYCRGFHNSKEAGLTPWPDLKSSNSCF